jgi:hypothetical protein
MRIGSHITFGWIGQLVVFKLSRFGSADLIFLLLFKQLLSLVVIARCTSRIVTWKLVVFAASLTAPKIENVDRLLFLNK